MLSTKIIYILLFFTLLGFFGCSQKYPLFDAAKQGDIQKVNTLLNQSDGIDKYVKGKNLICIAIDTGNSELLNLLISRNADLAVECSKEQWDTPILRAVKQNNVNITRELMKYIEISNSKNNLSLLELPDRLGLTVFDYVRSSEMLNVFLENGIQIRLLESPEIMREIDQKYFKSIINFLFGKPWNDQKIIDYFDDVEIINIFDNFFINIMCYAFYHSENFYINQQSLNTLVKNNKKLCEKLLFHVDAIFSMRIGLLVESNLSDDQKKILNFIYYNSLKIGKEIIVNYGNRITLEHINDNLTEDFSNDCLNIKNSIVVEKIEYIKKKYTNEIFSNLMNGKKIEKLFHELDYEFKNLLVKMSTLDNETSITTNMIREASEIILLGKSALSNDLQP